MSTFRENRPYMFVVVTAKYILITNLLKPGKLGDCILSPNLPNIFEHDSKIMCNLDKNMHYKKTRNIFFKIYALNRFNTIESTNLDIYEMKNSSHLSDLG